MVKPFGCEITLVAKISVACKMCFYSLKKNEEKKSDCQPCLKMAMSFSYEIALVAKKVVACKKMYLVRFVYNKIQIGLD